MSKREEIILEKFARVERQRVRLGSGDDGFYEGQIIKFIGKNKEFLIDLIKFTRIRIKEEVSK